MKKIIYGSISLLILIMIYLFSAQSGSSSGALSSSITTFIQNLLPFLKKFEQLESIIRSLAHFSIYLFEGLFLTLFLNEYKIDNLLRVVLVFILLYAISDEIHQAIASINRAGEFVDVVKDFLGATCGALFSNKVLLKK